MHTAASLVERLWREGKRLRPRDVVAEFDKTIHDELDLTREAANCSQLRRNFLRSGAAAGARDPLGLDGERSARHGAHGRHSDRPHRRPDRRRHRLQAARARRCRDLLHAGVPRRVLPRGHAPRQHLRRRRPVEPRQVHRARLRHHGHAVGAGQELPRAEFPRVLPPRLPPRRDDAHRVGLGAGRTRASTSSRARSASCASRSSTGR